MLRGFRPRAGAVIAALVLGLFVAVPACSSDEGGGGSSTSTPFGGKKAEKTLGPSGGTLTSSDGNVVVVVPAGALASETLLWIEPAKGAPSGALAAVELGPTGQSFALPVDISIAFGSIELDKVDISKFRLGTVVEGAWQAIAGSTVDESARKVMGQSTHFSPWGVLTDPGGPLPEAGPCTTLNMCAEGCPCEAKFTGASCQQGTTGTPGCEKCACDGVTFSCGSCATSDGGMDAPTSDGGVDASSDAGGGPSCKGTHSCDQKTMNQSCQEYDANTPSSSIQSACVGGTYSAAPCDLTASLGGCENAGNPCSIIWYFPGINPWTVADIKQKCLNNGKTYVSPP